MKKNIEASIVNAISKNIKQIYKLEDLNNQLKELLYNKYCTIAYDKDKNKLIYLTIKNNKLNFSLQDSPNILYNTNTIGIKNNDSIQLLYKDLFYFLIEKLWN